MLGLCKEINSEDAKENVHVDREERGTWTKPWGCRIGHDSVDEAVCQPCLSGNSKIHRISRKTTTVSSYQRLDTASKSTSTPSRVQIQNATPPPLPCPPLLRSRYQSSTQMHHDNTSSLNLHTKTRCSSPITSLTSASIIPPYLPHVRLKVYLHASLSVPPSPFFRAKPARAVLPDKDHQTFHSTMHPQNVQG